MNSKRRQCAETAQGHQQRDRAVIKTYGFWGKLNAKSAYMAETMKMYHHCNPQPFYGECPNQRFCDRIENMKKITEAA